MFVYTLFLMITNTGEKGETTIDLNQDHSAVPKLMT